MREARRRRVWLARHPGRPVDVVVSHVEVNERHGTGVLTQRLFGGAADLVSVRSHDNYDARQRFGAWSVRIPQPDPGPAVVARRVRTVFQGASVRRVVAIPFYPDDVRNALALQELSGGPLCTYVMDDRNVEGSGMPDELLRELLSRSALRVAVSEELRDAYQRKFGLPFAFVPPVIDPALIPRAPVPTPEGLGSGRGVMIGNVWGQSWLARLCHVMEGTGVEIDWYSSADLRWHVLGVEELRRAGIRWHPGPPDGELVAILRRAAFAVLPTGTLDAEDDNRAIARLSLPSKLVFTTAAAHLPALVLGHPETAAARFVTRAAVGLAVPYERAAFAAAVAEIVRPEVQAVLRGRAAALAPTFSAEGAGEWIWRSLSLGRPADDRWERLTEASAHRRA
jgi:hypothetical protein